jgi:hypothetical protein
MKKKKSKMKSENSFRKKMPSSKSLAKKGGKQVAGRDYSEDLEEYEDKQGKKSNKPVHLPADISGALRKSKEGYSKKPRVKPDKRKG